MITTMIEFDYTVKMTISCVKIRGGMDLQLFILRKDGTVPSYPTGSESLLLNILIIYLLLLVYFLKTMLNNKRVSFVSGFQDLSSELTGIVIS